jgi:hypothetical protein
MCHKPDAASGGTSFQRLSADQPGVEGQSAFCAANDTHDHALRRRHLGMAHRRARLDVDNDGDLYVNEVVGGIVELRLAAVRRGVAVSPFA